MGPSERLSKGLSHSFDKSSGGRAASRAKLLHSTCIGSQSPAFSWIALAPDLAAAGGSFRVGSQCV
jgi:hypothetical protein